MRGVGVKEKHIFFSLALFCRMDVAMQLGSILSFGLAFL